MDKKEFLDILENELDFLSNFEKREILSDYVSRFEKAATRGISEKDFAGLLGSPVTIARSYQNQSNPATAPSPYYKIENANDNVVEKSHTTYSDNDKPKKDKCVETQSKSSKEPQCEKPVTQYKNRSFVGYVFRLIFGLFGIFLLATLVVCGFAVSVSLIVGSLAYGFTAIYTFSSLGFSIAIIIIAVGVSLLSIYMFYGMINATIKLVKMTANVFKSYKVRVA